MTHPLAAAITTIDLSGWGHIEITGVDRVRFLQGLTTINLATLPTGGHAWGAILSPKGRVLSVVEATVAADHILLHCEPGLIEKTLGILDRYAVMDEVAARAVQLAAHKQWASPADAWTAPVVLAPPPGPVSTPEHAEIARVEAGILRYGQDVDEDVFPFESPLGHFLDYQKGCYVGQEPVFRVHAQGKAARTLRGLRVEGPGPVERGDVVAHATRATAGTVTSAALSPRLGSIALAFLHRSVWDVGGEVAVGPSGRTARVVELPFPGS
jgi:folate-binding protein YgfZ